MVKRKERGGVYSNRVNGYNLEMLNLSLHIYIYIYLYYSYERVIPYDRTHTHTLIYIYIYGGVLIIPVVPIVVQMNLDPIIPYIRTLWYVVHEQSFVNFDTHYNNHHQS
jgi:hypothetical protein